MSNAFANSLSLRDALMRGFRIYDHTEKVGERCRVRPRPEGSLTWVCSKAECRTSFCRGIPGLGWARGFGSHAAEAPRPETQCHVKSGTVVSRNANRPCRKNSRRPLGGVARPWAPAPPQTASRVQSFVATDSNGLLRPCVGDGRNTVLRRGRCASPVFEAVRGWLGCSPQDRGGEGRFSHRPLVVDTLLNMKS